MKTSLSFNLIFQTAVEIYFYCIKAGCCNQKSLERAKEHYRFFWLQSWEICQKAQLGNILAGLMSICFSYYIKMHV